MKPEDLFPLKSPAPTNVGITPFTKGEFSLECQIKLLTITYKLKPRN